MDWNIDHLRLRLERKTVHDDDDPPGLGPLGLQLRQNIVDLMNWRHWTQATLAERMGVKQPWVSKRMNGLNKFSVDDLEKLAAAFEMEPCDLLVPGHGKHDRRKLPDRRGGIDRRKRWRTNVEP